MAIFASYNSFSSYSNNAWFDVLSFGSLGQANTFCSKVPNIKEDLIYFKFIFQCDANYYIDEVYSVGLLEYES